MTRSASTKLVLAPGSAYASVARALQKSGLEQIGSGSAPLRAGEPEVAEWRSRDGDHVVLTYNPVLDMRVVDLEGVRPEARAELSARLPILSAPALLAMLDDTDAARVLLALFAAEITSCIAALPQAQRLTAHSDARVARIAKRVRDALAPLAQRAGAALFRSLDARRTLLYTALGPSDRRQCLRWLAEDRAAPADDVIDVLRHALSDRDWETRMTAMLVAARIDAVALAKPVRRVELPEGARSGLDREELRTLDLLRRLAFGLLARRLVAPAELEHLVRIVRDGSAEIADRASLLAWSLLTPLPLVEERDAQTEGFVWIPPLPHWVGASQLRRVTSAGFSIHREPLELGSLSEAHAACERLGARLPTPDEWEMAMRGPDGRTRPWGLGVTREAIVESPWKLLWRPEPEWTIEEGRPWLVNTRRDGRFDRSAAEGTERAAVRPVLLAS